MSRGESDVRRCDLRLFRFVITTVTGCVQLGINVSMSLHEFDRKTR